MERKRDKVKPEVRTCELSLCGKAGLLGCTHTGELTYGCVTRFTPSREEKNPVKTTLLFLSD